MKLIHVDLFLVSFEVQGIVHARQVHTCKAGAVPLSYMQSFTCGSVSRSCFHFDLSMLWFCFSPILSSFLHLFNCCLYSFFISYILSFFFFFFELWVSLCCLDWSPPPQLEPCSCLSHPSCWDGRHFENFIYLECVYQYMPWCACEGWRSACRIHFSLSPMELLGFQLRLSGRTASTSTRWASSLQLSPARFYWLLLDYNVHPLSSYQTTAPRQLFLTPDAVRRSLLCFVSAFPWTVSPSLSRVITLM